MESIFVETNIQKLQNCLYDKYWEPNQTRTRFIPIALADATLEVVKCAIGIVAQLALTLINIVGALFGSNSCSLEDGQTSFYRAFENIALLAVSPLTLGSNIVGNLRNPQEGLRMSYLRDRTRPATST